MVGTIEPSGSDDTRACRLHNRGIPKQVLRLEADEASAWLVFSAFLSFFGGEKAL